MWTSLPYVVRGTRKRRSPAKTAQKRSSYVWRPALPFHGFSFSFSSRRCFFFTFFFFSGKALKFELFSSLCLFFFYMYSIFENSSTVFFLSNSPLALLICWWSSFFFFHRRCCVLVWNPVSQYRAFFPKSVALKSCGGWVPHLQAAAKQVIGKKRERTQEGKSAAWMTFIKFFFFFFFWFWRLTVFYLFF